MTPDEYAKLEAPMNEFMAQRPPRPLLDVAAINAIAASAIGASAGAGFEPLYVPEYPDLPERTPQAWPELIPLADDCGDTEAPKPFPFAALGDVLGHAAQAIADTF